MKTQLFNISEDNIDQSQLEEAAKIIKNNGTVAFPTETVYGLGANALDPEAVNRIFEAKGRPNDNPLIVHISSIDQLEGLVLEIPEKAKILAEAFWPGPLTMIFKKSKRIPKEVSAGLSTVGIRYPKNKIARALISEAGLPIAAPSANLSGKPSPTQAKHVFEDLDSRVDGIILSDDSKVGIESTVINISEDIPVILRPGMISRTQIEERIGPVELSKGITKGEVPERPASPGMKYKHYAPKADVLIVTGNKDEIKDKVVNFYKDHPKYLAVLTSVNEENDYNELGDTIIRSLGESAEEYAHNLFSFLRELDELNRETILVEQFKVDDESLAIFDRLLHSSNYTFI